jgi:AbrB family looped-hinge helix DNA binding protein
MVLNVEVIVKVDKQGRIILPKDVRRAIGMGGEMEMVCRVVGDRIILERFSMEDIHKAFSELEEIAPSLELDTVKVEGEDKYVDREYALRKIGIRSIS